MAQKKREEIKSIEKIEILKWISQIHRGQFDERRHYEWRIIFAVLGIYSSLILGELTSNTSISETNSYYLIMFGIGGLFLITAIYLNKINVANRKNKKFAEIAEDHLLALSGEDFKEALTIDEGGEGTWSYWWQVAMILVFAIITGIILSI